MEENKNPLPFEGAPAQPATPSAFPTGARELILCAVVLLAAVLMANFLTVGGFYLAFGITSSVIIIASVVYLLRNGRKLTFYSGTLLALSVVIALSFGRSEDGFVKFVMFIFLCFSANLGLCLLAGKNRRDPKGFTSLADAFRAVFSLGLGKCSPAISGLTAAGKARKGSKTATAILSGLLIAVPLVLVLVVLLSSADAAFEGLVSKLPKIDLWEPIVALVLGIPMGCFFYSRAAALHHADDPAAAPKTGARLSTITVGTVLGAVSLVYAVYLFSQLAYFVGGFQGILPEEFTMAEYARRGFFEMAVICTINLFVISLSVGLTRKEGNSPLPIRLLCLFIGIITLFLTVTASAKMVMYIGSYGLTRLRVLTEVIILFMALATVFVCIWLFARKMPYMKAIVLTALLLGSIVVWADVDTVVACYNVRAYQSGALETVDMAHLEDLSDGAIPYIAELAQDKNPEVAKQAISILKRRAYRETDWESNDFRAWNIADAIADVVTSPYAKNENASFH